MLDALSVRTEQKAFKITLKQVDVNIGILISPGKQSIHKTRSSSLAQG